MRSDGGRGPGTRRRCTALRHCSKTVGDRVEESIPYFAAARCTDRRIRIVSTPLIRRGVPGGSLLPPLPSRLPDILRKIRYRGYRVDGTRFTAAARWKTASKPRVSPPLSLFQSSFCILLIRAVRSMNPKRRNISKIMSTRFNIAKLILHKSQFKWINEY